VDVDLVQVQTPHRVHQPLSERTVFPRVKVL
jgi:hypothetical protein